MIKKNVCVLLIIIMAASSVACSKVDITEKWYKENVNEIKSLDSKDYSDLEFLKDLLKDKKIVSLGENFHSVGDYRTIKTRLIKYLHEELGFDAVGFESGLGESAMVMNSEDLSSKDMMKYSILPVWHSKETLELFDYIKEQKDTDNPMELFGFDMQFTSMYFIEYMAQWLEKVDEKVGEDYYNLDIGFLQDYYALVNKYAFETGHAEEYQQLIDNYKSKYDEMVKYIKDNRSKLEAVYPDNTSLVDSALRTIENRINIVKMMMADNVEGYAFRDVIMADNVKWYMTANPDKKIIIWGHNDHIAKNTSQMLALDNDEWINSFESMGELLNKEYGKDMYVIGLYMQGGKASAITTQQVFDIPNVPDGSLEEIIGRSGYETSFVDFSSHEKQDESNEWMFTELYASEDGLTDEVVRSNVQKFVPRDQYDGIILLDRVYPPSTYKVFE
ncbi:putative hydrolase YbfO [Vallitalea longa]|uniref:Hydrolase YbfO n=1 Tax=Vallitalea longa TaxID=2936439 RepID=A0A9W5YBN0_9FIRM|nr:erythromycin esterase family protein [Vallitalea longa]GKX28303.1 putative hydrolase YbfO [Vallitalea longa]